ncbi:unnamed protein product [Camellia sinensis]
MHRSWMHLHNRRSPQYIDRVREFILFARDHIKPGADKIWCPCYRCNNHIQKIIEEVEIHLYAYGVVTSYTRWVGVVSDYDLLALDSISGGGQADVNLFPNVDSSWKVCLSMVERQGYKLYKEKKSRAVPYDSGGSGFDIASRDDNG